MDMKICMLLKSQHSGYESALCRNNEDTNKNILNGRFKERKKSTFACGVILVIKNAWEGILKI